MASESVNETNVVDEAECERYLFGEMSDSEREAFEESYFVDDVFFEKFVAIKTELLDLYARGELDAPKQIRMDAHFTATAPRRRHVSESRDFIRAVTAISERHAPVAIKPQASLFEKLIGYLTLPRFVTATALLVVAAGSWFVINRLRTSDPGREATPGPTLATHTNENQPNSNSTPPSPTVDNSSNRSELATNRNGRTDRSPSSIARRTETPPHRVKKGNFEIANPDREDTARGDAVNEEFSLTIATVGRDEGVPAVTLQPGATRAPSDENTLTLRTDTNRRDRANIALIFKTARYPRYLVSITDVSGGRITKQTFAASKVSIRGDGSSRIVVRTTNWSRLRGGDFVIKLDGITSKGAIETIEEYYLHVRRSKDESAPTPQQPESKP